MSGTARQYNMYNVQCAGSCAAQPLRATLLRRADPLCAIRGYAPAASDARAPPHRWKQRITKENLHNAPVYLPPADDDDDRSDVSSVRSAVSSIRSSRTGASVSTQLALEKIEALQRKLEEEQRRREAVEKELARLSELTKSAGAQ